MIYSNTEYKFYTNEPSADNWEDRGSNRWAIYPLMDDVITNFIANIPTGLNQQKEVEVRVMRTPTGIAVTFDGEADIELYGINGTLIEKTRVANNYSRDLGTGTYIIRVNGQSKKFVR
ncbi:MAG: T9SS type A sorting domain-containing protein [Paludibacteraceae bacterium]